MTKRTLDQKINDGLDRVKKVAKKAAVIGLIASAPTALSFTTVSMQRAIGLDEEQAAIINSYHPVPLYDTGYRLGHRVFYGNPDYERDLLSE